MGQFLPGMAGGANTGNGPMGDSLLNPFDYLLLLEGTILFTAHATKRLGAGAAGRAAAPFTVSARGAGYASAADSDESPRGEQWIPLWSSPLLLCEFRRLLAEGRAQLGAPTQGLLERYDVHRVPGSAERYRSKVLLHVKPPIQVIRKLRGDDVAEQIPATLLFEDGIPGD